MDSIPQITCTRCGETFPATTEHFYKKVRGKHGLFSWCKKCHNALTTPNSRAWNKAHPDRRRQTQARYVASNPERSRQLRRYHYLQSDPQKNRAAVLRWQQENPEKTRAKGQRRIARKRALPATFTAEQWQTCLEYWHNTCAYCGAQQSFWSVLHQEHFIPLTRGGGYTADNIVPACISCNSSKNNTPADVWIKRRFKRRATQILERVQAYFNSLKDD